MSTAAAGLKRRDVTVSANPAPPKRSRSGLHVTRGDESATQEAGAGCSASDSVPVGSKADLRDLFGSSSVDSSLSGEPDSAVPRRCCAYERALTNPISKVTCSVDLPCAAAPSVRDVRMPCPGRKVCTEEYASEARCWFSQNIPGLRVFPGFFDAEHTRYLEACILSEGWFPELIRDAPAGDSRPPNQVMKFGRDVVRSAWLKRLMLDVMETATTFPPSIRCRVPGFDQAIINFYRVGEGIKQHVDLAKFEDGIASVSLFAPVVFKFKRVPGVSTDHPQTNSGDECKNAEPATTCVHLMLQPGDLLCMHGEARHAWSHGIDAQEYNAWNGSQQPRRPRVSITMRRLTSAAWEFTASDRNIKAGPGASDRSRINRS